MAVESFKMISDWRKSITTVLGYQDLGNKRIMIYNYSELFINPGIVRVQGLNNWIQFSTVTFDSIFSWFFSPSLSLQKVLVTV